MGLDTENLEEPITNRMDVAVASSSPLFFSFRTPTLSSSSSSISFPKAALAHNHRHVQAIRRKRTSLPAAISSSPISTATMVS